jgi:hypothetical protein
MTKQNSKEIQGELEELSDGSPIKPNKLNEALANLEANRSKRPKKVIVPEVIIKTQLSLEFWPDPVRKIPNPLLRGALFSVSKIREIAKKRELLSSVKGIEIRFKGERFNQTDLDVLEMLLHYGRTKPLESLVEFNAHQLLTDLGRPVGGDAYDQLKEEIARLASGLVEITFSDRKTFGGTLIKNFYRDETIQRYVVSFDEKMMMLYEQGATYIEIDKRLRLGANNLAKWLYRWYLSHAHPLDYKVETLKKLCGSNTKRTSDFRKALKVSLELLKKNDLIASWSINPETDLVRVVNKQNVNSKNYKKPIEGM